MRLIDADILADEIESMKISVSGRPATFDEAKSDVMQVIDEQKTVDAAEVLRDQWFSVKDKLPETEEEVLVLTVSKTGNVNVDKGYLLNGRFVHRGSAVVTHWMPLPEMTEEIQNA